MDGAGDFEAEAAKLSPQGRALLGLAAARMKPSPVSDGKPATFKDRDQVQRARDVLAPLADGNSDLLPIVAILDALLGPGKGAASDLMPGLGRSKPIKIGKPRALRRALWLDFAARLDPEKTMPVNVIYKAFLRFYGEFDDRGTNIRPPSGNFGYRDIFWELKRLPATIDPVVKYQTLRRWLKSREKDKSKRKRPM